MTAPIKTNRLRKCNYCKDKFSPFNTFQKFCFKDECIKAHNDTERSKKQRKLVKEYKSSDKSIQKQKAQQIFNKYIRFRDMNDNCISCDYSWKDGNRQAHASHYTAVGKSEALRFDENNVHKSCSICNSWKSGNLAEYRPALIKKIGIEEVLRLEDYRKLSKNYSLEELKNIIKIYTKKVKDLQNENYF